MVEKRKLCWKNQHHDETFDQFTTELRNLASTCEFGDLHESLLLYKVVDGIRSDKIRDFLLRKVIEMILEKAINICRTEEITKMQMKEMNSEKEVGGISRNQKWKKAQKGIGGSDLLNWNGQVFVLLVDYYSRYWDIEKLYRTDSATVIKKLKHIFSGMGIPEVMRSDNEPQYSSSSFKKFAKDCRFQHISSSPEYPRSNGLAGKTVQTMKILLEKAKDDNKDPYLTMLEARYTPADNYRSPTELAVGRQLRSALSANPNNLKIKTIDDDEFKERRLKDKEKQSKYYDQHTKEVKEFRSGEAVRMLRDGKWKPATVGVD